MISKYFKEKQRIIDTLRTIYNNEHNKSLLIKFSNTKDFGIALEMGFVDVKFNYDLTDFNPVWTKKAHIELKNYGQNQHDA